MKKSFEKSCFIFLVILLTYTGLYSYNKFINKLEKKDGGFANATPTKSNKFVCEATNFECVRNLMIDLNQYEENVLLFGNSQLGAINQFSKGEVNYAQMLSLMVNEEREKPIILRSIWMPNATLGEFNEIYSSIKKCSTKIDNLILPLFLDDMREQKIRESIRNYSSNICNSSKNLSLNKNNVETNLNFPSNSDNLDEKILKRIPVLKDIKAMNSHLRVFLYKLRNSIFGIKPYSKRKIVPAAYQFNLEALKKIIDSRGSLGIPTIIYVAPLLNISSQREIPYFNNDYLNYKKEMKDLCINEKCIYFDLDSIIPDNKWGYKNSTSFKEEKKEIDFMHFTFSGHQIMSKKLNIILNKLIIK